MRKPTIDHTLSTDKPSSPRIRQSFALYTDRKILWIFVNGIASGFPWVVIGSSMTLWLKEAGLTRTAIGFFGSIFAVYTFNFLWAPLVDGIKLPLLSRLGRRRSWIVFAQCVLLCAIIGLSFTDPAISVLWTSLLAMIVAIAGATQDIAIDAYRIDVLADEDSTMQAAGAAAATSGWWTGYSLLGALALFAADIDGVAWSQVYVLLAFFVVVFIVFSCLINEPSVSATTRVVVDTKGMNPLQCIVRWLSTLAIDPLRDFFVRYGYVALAILLFIFLFKIGEAFLGRMSLVFYSEIGFDKTQIATYSKLITWWVTILFSVISGGFVIRFGLVKGLLIGGVAMASTNLLFAMMAVVGPQEWAFLVTVILDGFTASFSTVAFVAFISHLTSTTFSATQYALMASLGNLGRTLVSSSSGAVVDGLGGNWAIFFILTAFMVIPSLILLMYYAKKRNIWRVDSR